MGLWIAAVFASDGRLDWNRGWICMIAWVVGTVAAGLSVRRANPSLTKARANWRRKDTKPFDRLFISACLPLTFIQPALAGLEVVRSCLLSMPLATVHPGLVLFEMAFVTWAMMANPLAESTVRIQTDRNHKVVSSGPYRAVRHPMYVGAILLYPASALIFGSIWALALSGLMAGLFVFCTAFKYRTLRRELPRYQEFAASTRYRLIPGLW
jgi:protein-S-isoprenylcysteine O-methyltransferase Ste14